MEKLYAQLALDAYQDNIPASMKIENRFNVYGCVYTVYPRVQLRCLSRN
jgi:hypothetical protein